MLFRLALDIYDSLSLKVLWSKSCSSLRLITLTLFLSTFNKNVDLTSLRRYPWRFVLVTNLLRCYKEGVLPFAISLITTELLEKVCGSHGFKTHICRKSIFPR